MAARVPVTGGHIHRTTWTRSERICELQAAALIIQFRQYSSVGMSGLSISSRHIKTLHTLDMLLLLLAPNTIDRLWNIPVLVFVRVASLFLVVLVLLNWLLLLEGRGLGLPCYAATFIGTYFCELACVMMDRILEDGNSPQTHEGNRPLHNRQVASVAAVEPCCHSALYHDNATLYYVGAVHVVRPYYYYDFCVAEFVCASSAMGDYAAHSLDN